MHASNLYLYYCTWSFNLNDHAPVKFTLTGLILMSSFDSNNQINYVVAISWYYYARLRRTYNLIKTIIRKVGHEFIAHNYYLHDPLQRVIDAQ